MQNDRLSRSGKKNPSGPLRLPDKLWENETVRPVVLTGCLALGLGLVCGCDDDAQPAPSTAASARRTQGVPQPKLPPPRPRPHPPTPKPTPAPASEKPAPSAEPTASSKKVASWIADEVVDVAPAGPATATASGVVLVTRDDRLAVARSGTLPRSKNPTTTPVRAISLPPGALVALRKGPAVLAGYAYWVSDRRLVRMQYDGGRQVELEVLANDARPYTRVSAPPTLEKSEPACVAYVAQVSAEAGQERLRAQLWVDGIDTPLNLTEEGASANSVAFSRTSQGLAVLSMEGRTSMTPVHARMVTFAAKKPKLGEDVVVWVGGPSEPTTELTSLGFDQHRLAFVPLGRGVTDFGLASIDVGGEPHMDGAVNWEDYPNGMTPAPVAAATVCNTPVVLFAKPSTKEPGSPQELHLAPLDSDGFGPSRVVGRSKAFANISIAAVRGGALIAYTADRRTWARTLRCQ